MVVLDIRNSRMKDFYDLWYLAKTRKFDLATLRMAIHSTFERRRTPIPTELPFALTEGFLLDESKLLQWRGFVRRLQLESATPSLEEVGLFIARFLEPLLADTQGTGTWSSDGEWRS